MLRLETEMVKNNDLNIQLKNWGLKVCGGMVEYKQRKEEEEIKRYIIEIEN